MSARKTVTVVFCDLANSTPLAEALDPEVMRSVMERYFEVVRLELERHGGTVEKFIGDAVMAVFGIPTAHDDDALRAVRSAIDMRTAMGALNAELERTHGVRLSIRTGLNTGEVVAGDPSVRKETFATGAAVSMAQRLESTALAGEILLGDATYRLVSNAVLVEPVDPLTLKGVAEPVAAWRLLGVVEGAEPFSRRFDIPMVGRTSELDALRGELDAAIRERKCRVATIVGPAGIGKSRLGNELFAATKGQAATLVGRCLAYGEGITYWPLRGVVLSATGGLSRSGIEEFLADAEGSERIAERLAGAVGTEESPGGEETFWAVRRFLEHVARDEPLIVGVDELQWAEPTFLDLIEYLVGWTTDSPILIVGLARPELLELRPTWPATSSLVLPLEPLSGSDCERLVEALGGSELTPDERGRILDGAEGNPLFVEQMLALAVEGEPRHKIPPSIHALLAARLDRLAPDERAVLERASVIGREFTAGAVASLSGDESVSPTLLSLVRRDLTEPDRSLIPGDDGFRFRHILIRDAAYQGVTKESRAELHERYANWLAQAAGELDEIVGYHLEQAFRYSQELNRADTELAVRAGERLARAGLRALGRNDLPAATALLTRAVALLPDSHAQRREVLPRLGTALMRTGDFVRAERILDEALESVRASGDKRLELRTLIDREFVRTFTRPGGSLEELVNVADTAIPLLEELGDDFGLSRAWWLKSEADVNACRWGARAAKIERALQHAKRAGDVGEEAALSSLLAQALQYGPTPVPEALRRCDAMLVTLTHDRALEAGLRTTMSVLQAMRGDFDEARRLWDEARVAYEELGMRARRAGRSLDAAEIELLAGNPAEAVSILRWACEKLDELGVQSLRATVAAFLADALCVTGDFSEARRFAEVAAESGAPDDVITQVMWRIAVSKADGDAVLAEEARRLADETDGPDLRARALLAVGELAEARRLYEAKGNVAAVARLSALARSS